MTVNHVRIKCIEEMCYVLRKCVSYYSYLWFHIQRTQLLSVYIIHVISRYVGHLIQSVILLLHVWCCAKMSQYVNESQIIVLSDRYMITWCVLQQRPVMTDHLANKIRISNRLIMDLNMLFCWVIYLVRKQSENRVRIDREQTWDKRETKREHREKQRGEQRLKWRTLRENETERRRGLQSGWKKEKETGRNELNSQQVTKFAF